MYSKVNGEESLAKSGAQSSKTPCRCEGALTSDDILRAAVQWWNAHRWHPVLDDDLIEPFVEAGLIQTPVPSEDPRRAWRRQVAQLTLLIEPFIGTQVGPWMIEQNWNADLYVYEFRLWPVERIKCLEPRAITLSELLAEMSTR